MAGGMCGGRACMPGGMCMAGGACVVGGMHGGLHAQGDMHGWGVCMVGGLAWQGVCDMHAPPADTTAMAYGQ